MPAARLDFSVVNNEDFTSPVITIHNPDGTPHNLTGYILHFQVRTKQGAPGSPLLDLIMNSGIHVISAAAGTIQIAFGRFAVVPGEHYQDLVEEKAGYRTVIFAGRFNVASGVARW